MKTKCVKVTLYLYTNDLPKGNVWEQGMVYIPKDQVRKGEPVRKGTMFNSFAGLETALTDVLTRNKYEAQP